MYKYIVNRQQQITVNFPQASETFDQLRSFNSKIEPASKPESATAAKRQS